MAKRIYTSKEVDILETLSEFKWGDTFTCYACDRVNELIKSEYPSGRRCKCKVDESVTAHTIFDNIRMPVVKAYNILDYLDNFSKRNWKERSLTKGRNDSISANDFADAYSRGEVSRTDFDKQIIEWANDTKIFIARIAREFEVEENTVRLLFEKIDARIEDRSSEDLNIRIMDFFSNRDLDYKLGLLMFPMREEDEWNKTELKKNGKTYKVMQQPYLRKTGDIKGLAWRLCLVTESNGYRNLS